MACAGSVRRPRSRSPVDLRGRTRGRRRHRPARSRACFPGTGAGLRTHPPGVPRPAPGNHRWRGEGRRRPSGPARGPAPRSEPGPFAPRRAGPPWPWPGPPPRWAARGSPRPRRSRCRWPPRWRRWRPGRPSRPCDPSTATTGPDPRRPPTTGAAPLPRPTVRARDPRGPCGPVASRRGAGSNRSVIRPPATCR